MGNLIVADGEYSGMAAQYVTIGKNMDKYIVDYLKIMDSIVKEKLIEGETARAIAAYSNKAAVLKGQLQDIMKVLQKQLGNYVTDIDKVDQYLY